ncbi:unnamed protein product [Protopolystoma xenopodis]|uniref:Uncharacterized protein n=1 Tax=Protopolystoma xenopodis TaxID=117903 RepID=A0A448XIZ3_9PLAT|nr:unnamed protein product [Protopolystoma xenopodis]
MVGVAADVVVVAVVVVAAAAAAAVVVVVVVVVVVMEVLVPVSVGRIPSGRREKSPRMQWIGLAVERIVPQTGQSAQRAVDAGVGVGVGADADADAEVEPVVAGVGGAGQLDARGGKKRRAVRRRGNDRLW